MKIFVINGPNLNLLGKREPGIYGALTLSQIEGRLKSLGADKGFEVVSLQSNIEGELVEMIQRADEESVGVILNAGAYTHTSVALRDAVAAISKPVVEVHISNPHAREEFRHVSMLSKVCAGLISGFGFHSYILALHWFFMKDDEESLDI
jgi:3-dehydroquinate dehydratase-2